MQVSYCLASYQPSRGPCLIGLTGRIATGKSSIFKRLANKGAYPIDCDKVWRMRFVRLSSKLCSVGYFPAQLPKFIDSSAKCRKCTAQIDSEVFIVLEKYFPFFCFLATVFIRIVATATINFGCSSVRLLIE